MKKKRNQNSLGFEATASWRFFFLFPFLSLSLFLYSSLFLALFDSLHVYLSWLRHGCWDQYSMLPQGGAFSSLAVQTTEYGLACDSIPALQLRPHFDPPDSCIASAKHELPAVTVASPCPLSTRRVNEKPMAEPKEGMGGNGSGDIDGCTLWACQSDVHDPEPVTNSFTCAFQSCRCYRPAVTLQFNSSRARSFKRK